MTNSLYGQIPEFYGDGDDWNVYYERLEQFFTVNDIPENKRSAFLISVIGSYTYKTLRDLCHPVLPKDKTFNELCELLRRQFSPQISIFRERSKFYNARQESFENISAWYVKVKKLSVDCRFGANLEMVLLDKFITGLKPGPILDRLCEENEAISLKDAHDIAVNKESALAVELPPNPIDASCYECCVPPPPLPVNEEVVHDDQEEVPSRPPSSAAGDSGFKEPRIAICPPKRDTIFQRQQEIEAGGAPRDAPTLLRRTSKALLGKPIGSPMAEMPPRAPELDMICNKTAPHMAMAMACPPMPMLDSEQMIRPMMRKTMVQRPKEVEEEVIIEPTVNDDVTEEKKKKSRRGCRGGRKNRRRTDTE